MDMKGRCRSTVSLVLVGSLGHIWPSATLEAAARSKIPTRSPLRRPDRIGQHARGLVGRAALDQVSHPVSKARTPLSGAMKRTSPRRLGEDAAWIDEVTVRVRRSPMSPRPLKALQASSSWISRPELFQMGDHDNVENGMKAPCTRSPLTGFQMSKYETTNAQYAAYLNAVMSGGQIQVVSAWCMHPRTAVVRSRTADTRSSSSYSQIEYNQGRFTVLSRDGKAMADHPVVGVSWYGGQGRSATITGTVCPQRAEWNMRPGADITIHTTDIPGASQLPWTTSKANYDGHNPLKLMSYPYTSPVGLPMVRRGRMGY